MDILPSSIPPLTFTGMLTLTGLDPVLPPLVLWKVQRVEIGPHPKDPQYLDFFYEGSPAPHDFSNYLTTRLTQPIRKISGLYDAMAVANFVIVKADYNLTPVELGTNTPIIGSITGLLQPVNNYGYVTPAKFTASARLWRADRVSQYGAALTATPRVWNI